MRVEAHGWLTFACCGLIAVCSSVAIAQDDASDQNATDVPAAPANVRVSDHRWDNGTRLDLFLEPSPDDGAEEEPKKVVRYTVSRSGELGGLYTEVAKLEPGEKDYKRVEKQGEYRLVIDELVRGESYFFRVRAVGPDGQESEFIETTQAAIPTREWFRGDRSWLAIITLVVCGSVVFFIQQARSGRSLFIRKIPGLEAVDEAVGRATEMGRSCLFVPGIQDMNDIQTVAGITVLSRVAQTAAEYGAKVEVPTARSLVMTTARETVQSSFLSAGRPDAYNEELIYYVTDEQFGFVAYLAGMMVREKPAACFYMGSFFAESLILAETGNAIGAIQVAGTAQPAQLPFFVAACDYTLIGEEFFAASAYLSGEPDQLGSLKGQDVGKLIVGTLIVIGCVLLTIGASADLGGQAGGVTESIGELAQTWGDYLQDTVLR